MDWFKVKTQYVEYQFSTAPAEVFKTWILVMSYVSATECKPLRNALCKRYGDDNITNLEKWCVDNGVTLQLIIDKVYEDVERVKSRKLHDRNYMSKYRCKTLRKHLRKPDVMGKIREEKIRIYTSDCSSSLETKEEDIKATKQTIDAIINKMIEVKRLDSSRKGLLYKRYGKSAKELAINSKNDIELACKAIDWVSKWCNDSKLNWELETVNKHYLSGLSKEFKSEKKPIEFVEP